MGTVPERKVKSLWGGGSGPPKVFTHHSSGMDIVEMYGVSLVPVWKKGGFVFCVFPFL